MRGIILIAVGSLMTGSGLHAQASISSTKYVGDCSSGLRGGGPNCAPGMRLVIDLRRHGKGAPSELNGVVTMGASTGGAFRLTPEQATPADSGIYGVIDVTRNGDGEYTVKTSVAGVPATFAQTCNSVATGKTGDLEFGAYLSAEAAQLVRCVSDVRAKLTSQ